MEPLLDENLEPIHKKLRSAARSALLLAFIFSLILAALAYLIALAVSSRHGLLAALLAFAIPNLVVLGAVWHYDRQFGRLRAMVRKGS